jgi:hypothetical protein
MNLKTKQDQPAVNFLARVVVVAKIMDIALDRIVNTPNDTYTIKKAIDYAIKKYADDTGTCWRVISTFTPLDQVFDEYMSPVKGDICFSRKHPISSIGKNRSKYLFLIFREFLLYELLETKYRNTEIAEVGNV